MTRRDGPGRSNAAQRLASSTAVEVSAAPDLGALTLLALAPDAVRSDAGQVATLLLVDRALRDAGMTPDELIALCRRPGAMVALHAAVEEFGELSHKLLLDGAILPGSVQMMDLAHMRVWRPFPFNEEADCDWRVLSLTLDDRWRRDSADGLEHLERNEAERFAHASRSGHPLFVLGQSDEVTPLIRLAAHRCLDGGVLDAGILSQTVLTVTGHGRADVEKRLEHMAAEGMRFDHLRLGDLSLAVRPGLPLHRVAALLERFACQATNAKTAEDAGSDDDEDEDGDPRAGTRSTSTIGTALSKQGGSSRSSRPAARSATTAVRTTSPAEETSRSNDQDAGSIIIQPEPDDGKSEAAGARRLTVETMAGLGEAREWALDLKIDLDLWRSGKLRWDEMSTRLLLHGPPGTGKTSFARALANTLGLPLHVASVQVWLEPGYLGSVLKRMGAAFAAAETAAPTILFIDEADAIGRRQPDTREYADYWNAIVNRMLELMDGAVKSEGVIVVGATNRPEALDVALTRSGRWERKIELPRPDRAALEAIIAHHLGADLDQLARAVDGIDAANGLDASRTTPLLLNHLSRRAVGRTGADIERLVREARGRARRQKRALRLDDLLAVLDVARPRRSKALRRRMAIHEAGHALVQHALRIGTLVSLSIEDEDGGSTVSRFDASVEVDRSWIITQLATFLAGRAAETLILGDVSAGSGGGETSDLAMATQVALAMEIELGFGAERPLTHRSTTLAQALLLRPGPLADAVETRLQEASALATATLEMHRGSLIRLADALEAAGSLDAAEIAAILGPVPEVPPTDDGDADARAPLHLPRGSGDERTGTEPEV